MRRNIDKVSATFALTIALWLAGPILRLAAQPMEVREGTSRYRLTFYQAIHAPRTFNTPIDGEAFTKDTTVKKAILELYFQLANKKIDTSWVVAPDARKKRPGFDFSNTRISLAGLQKDATPARVLKEIFAQTNSSDLIVAICPSGGYYITTESRLALEPHVLIFWTIRIAFVLED